MTHPIERLGDDVHQRIRLGVLALLSGVARADFVYIRTTLSTTDGNLGRHLQVLEEARLVSITKEITDGRPRTWVRITRKGRAALRDEVEALKEIVALVEGSSEVHRPRSSIVVQRGSA